MLAQAHRSDGSCIRVGRRASMPTRFYTNGAGHAPGPFALRDIAEKIGAVLMRAEEGSRMIADVKSLRNAGSDDLAFFDNRKYAAQLAATKAGACILSNSNAKRAPGATATLTIATPYNAFAQALRLFYMDALRSKAASRGADPRGTLVDPTARIGEGVTIEPGVRSLSGALASKTMEGMWLAL